MRNIFLFGLCLLIVHTLSACATGKEARALARATLSQTLSYESQVNDKIKAEKIYYQKSTSAITESFEKSLKVVSRSIIERAAQTMQKTASSSKKDLGPIDITNYVAHLLKDIASNQVILLSVTKEYNDDLQNNLIQLDKKKSSFKTIRVGLENLQAKPSEAEQLKIWFKFARDVKDNMDKKKSTSKTD